MVAASEAGVTHVDVSPPPARLAGVSMTLGTTALTRMPALRVSTARASVRAITVAFETAYGTPPANGRTAARLDTSTIEPLPCSSISGRKARQERNAVVA